MCVFVCVRVCVCVCVCACVCNGERERKKESQRASQTDRVRDRARKPNRQKNKQSQRQRQREGDIPWARCRKRGECPTRRTVGVEAERSATLLFTHMSDALQPINSLSDLECTSDRFRRQSLDPTLTDVTSMSSRAICSSSARLRRCMYLLTERLTVQL